MSDELDDVLNALAKSKATFGYEFLTYGKYLLEVQALKAKVGFKGKSMIAEIKVISAEPPDALPEGCTPKAMPRPGTVVSYVEKLDNEKKGGGSRFKAFLMRLFGETDEAKMGIGVQRLITGEKQPGAYLTVRVDVKPKYLYPDEKRQLKGRWIENQNWITVEPTDAEFDAIEAKRTAAKLPPLAAVLAEMKAI